MSEQSERMRRLEENRRRVQEWLGGHTAPVRVRGRSYGGNRTPPDIDGLLSLLEEILPQAGWVVVVDGDRAGTFARRYCDQIRKRRPQTLCWWVERPQNGGREPGDSRAAGMERLDLENPDIKAFLDVNTVDLTLVPLQPQGTQLERAKRWVQQSYFVVLEGPAGLQPENIASGKPRRCLAQTYEETGGVLSGIL